MMKISDGQPPLVGGMGGGALLVCGGCSWLAHHHVAEQVFWRACRKALMSSDFTSIIADSKASCLTRALIDCAARRKARPK